MSWRLAHKYDRVGAKLADDHYSRRTVGSPQFMPPGETLVLVAENGLAVFGWWRPHPRSGIKAMNGLDGWTCTIFRNVPGSGLLASELVLEAERWLVTERGNCGPSGLLTYVAPRKIKSRNPGYCFKIAGYRKPPLKMAKPTSSKGLKLLWKPWELAGIQACGVYPQDEELRNAA